MGKAASKKNIARNREAHETAPDSLGPRLGMLVYRSHLPASAIAVVLQVSLPTLYRWFYGVNDVDNKFQRRVLRLSGFLQEALGDGRLPAQGILEQRVQVLVALVRQGLAKPQQ